MNSQQQTWASEATAPSPMRGGVGDDDGARRTRQREQAAVGVLRPWLPRGSGVRSVCRAFVVLCVGFASSLHGFARGNDAVPLAGRWQVRLDADDAGLGGAWFARPLETRFSLRLPGTTDRAGLGARLDSKTMRYDAVEFPYTRFPGVAEPARADERGFLVRRYFHLGPVWYERTVEIPERWSGQRVRLFLERALWRSDVWIDGRPAGTQDSLAAPHQHELGVLAPGRHRLTLRVDNRMQYPISTITHAYGPETQTRWNGVVGRMELQVRPAMAVEAVDVHPAPDRRSVRVVVRGSVAEGGRGEGLLRLSVVTAEGEPVAESPEMAVRSGPGPFRLESRLMLNERARAWDEFQPARYRLMAALRTSMGAQSRWETGFGFRHIEREGRQILVNGRPVFLRGTLDCAVYPRTGHPPTDLSEWLRILGTVRDYGFNHVRFHTWCPPEAAFEAADQLGLYLMPETAAWIDDWTRETSEHPPAVGKNPQVSAFLRAELRRIVDAYGNHPSFAFLSIGNEFGMQGTDWDQVQAWAQEIRHEDPRRLVTATTARRSLAGDELWVTHSANGKGTRGVGPARTDWDFTPAALATELPLIAHETGQRPVFPEYGSLLPKFRGPLAPLNYVRLRDRLWAAGLRGRDTDFERASARFQAVQYKAEHEAMRRTELYAGYQLLMLNDFTGQSEALVGVLDPFWESKGVVDARTVRAWNSPTVPLARFPRYTWSASDTFHAEVSVAHHGRMDVAEPSVEWLIVRKGSKAAVAAGRFTPARLPTGSVTRVGSIDVTLRDVGAPAALELRIECEGSRNAWPLWVYPTEERLVEPGPDIQVVRRYDAAARAALDRGGTVLLLAHGLTGPNAARTRFESVYWSAGWWGNAFSTLGVLCDPRHPALADFPNEGHSDWQWQTLTEGATTFRLPGLPKDYRPIVQAVPDFHYPGVLAQVFEVRVGKGRLLVCGYDLESDLAGRPAARQFRRSLLRYVESKAFRPRTEVDGDWLEKVLLAVDKP